MYTKETRTIHEQRKVWKMKLGFIGTGNMASAIMGGIIKKQIIPAQEIIGADLFAPGRERAKEQFGIQVTDSNKEVVDKAEVIVLSVKPQFYEDVINEIKGDIKESQIIITIAPGKTLAWLAEKFGKDVKIVRTMPNTPAMVGAGMTAACPNEHITEEEMAYIRTLLECFSRVEMIPERLMDVVVSTSGSSPAYVFMMIEAMADAAVSGGMPRPHISLRHRQFLEAPRWSWIQAGILGISKIWSALRQELRSRRYAYWKNADSEAQSLRP